MSSFFADEDNITFGVQGSNEAEVAQFSSTTDDVFFRFFTNNYSETDNFVTGTAIGSSNYDKTNSARNNLYFGHITEYSNVERIMTITDRRVGINTDPTATFHVVGSNIEHSNIVLVESINSPAFPAFVVSKYGKIGFGTMPTGSNSDVAVVIDGKIQVNGLQIGPGASGANGNLISAEGLVSPGGPGSSNYLMFGDNSMCNISSIVLKDSLFATYDVTASNVLYATNIAPVSGTTIQMSGSSLSNISDIVVNSGGYLAADVIQGSTDPTLVTFAGSMLCNISRLDTTLINTNKLSTLSATNKIDVDQKTLSNINTVKTDNVVTSTLHGDPLTNAIDVSSATLCNIEHIYMMPSGGVVHTNYITSVDPGVCNVNFMHTDVTNINNLWVNGDIRVRGDFSITNTSTCNTNQFIIENAGTGTALIVNQSGYENIAEFMDESNIVMVIKDGGQVAIGNFGTTFDDDAPNITSLFTVDNPAQSNQTAVKVIQNYIDHNRLELYGPTCNVVFTGLGRLGMGTALPEARVHLHHADGDTLEFLRLSSNATSQMIVTTDGRMGLGTDPALSPYRLDVAGLIRADGFALSGSGLIDARGMYDSTDSQLEFAWNVMSNISVIKPYQMQSVNDGTETDPAYTWEADADTGMFHPATNQVALSTNGTERMRLKDNGEIYMGVSSGNARLTVSHLNGKGLQVENDATKNRHVVLHEVADNDHQFFGMGVNTDVMRYQVGATAASHVFYSGTSSSASAEIMRVEGAGNVGIGTDTTKARLHITKTDAADTLLVENTSGQNKTFLIDKSGNVGIGTATVPFSFVVETTDAMLIPRGTDAERPSAPVQGAVRYNTTIQQFEGFGAGNAWGTLGGVKDTNMDTYISAETSPGDNNDELRFYNSNVETMRILPPILGGNIGIGTTTPATKLEVAGTVRAPTIEINTLSSTGSIIDVNQKQLSNVDILESDTVYTTYFSGYSANNKVIDTTQSTLSNMNFLKSCNVEVYTLTTVATNNTIDVDNKSLSNMANLFVNSTVDTDRTYTNVLRTRTLGGTIDMEQSILSNAAKLSGTEVNMDVVTSLTGTYINFSQLTLCNIDVTRTDTLQVSDITTTNAGGFIEMNNKSLSKTTILSKVNTLDLQKLTNTTTGLKLIDVDQSTLSNIAGLCNVTSLEVSQIRNNMNGGTIDMTQTTLDNLHTLKTDTVEVDTMTGTYNSENVILFTETTLSNLHAINMNPTGTIYTNNMNTVSGTDIDFNGKNVVNVQSLRVNGDIQVTGEFFVTQTTTCNTNQLMIENDGTGPALIVNQTGTENIAQFMDDSNIVVFMKDGGQTAFGSFGNTIDPGDTSFDALVYMNNPTDSNQMALHIVQNYNNKDVLRLDTVQSNVVFNSLGKMGMGVTSPDARIDVVSADNYTFLNYASSTTTNAFMIGNNGFVGVGTAADTQHAIKAVGIVSADQMAMNSVNSSNGLIDFNYVVLSNVNTIYVDHLNSAGFSASDIAINTLSAANSGSNIDCTQTSLSNIDIARMNTLEVTTVTSTGSNIDFSSRTLSNISGIKTMDLTTSSITPGGTNQEINFHYGHILNVDSLVVRSNITVELTGLNTYTNLPTDLVRIDLGTGKILDQYISSNIVRLMQNGLINPALLPPVETNRNTLMHTRDKVGIGLRNPQQKLHVHGTQVITSGRLGIGTTTPLSTFHIDDDNASLSTMYINNRGSVDTINILGSNQTPVFYITANCNVGIRTPAPMYNLHVNGTIYASDTVRTNAFASDSGTIDCGINSLSNILTAHMENLVVNGTMSVPATIVASTYTNSVSTNSISSYNNIDVEMTDPVHITGYSTSLYAAHDQLYGNTTNYTRIGLKVDNSILANTLLTVSDSRLKKDIVDSDQLQDFQAVLDLPVKRFRYKDNDSQEIIGFIAQEVEEVAPLAVRTVRGPVPTVTSSATRLSDTTLLVEANTDQLQVDMSIKLVVGNADVVCTIVNIDGDKITLNKSLPQGDVFIYGPIVDDVKLLDTDRLIPMAFNAIKKMHAEAKQQRQIIDMIVSRLTALEARLA